MVNMLVASRTAPAVRWIGVTGHRPERQPVRLSYLLGRAERRPRLTAYFKDTLKAKKVAVAWINNEFGKGGHNVFLDEMKKAGIEVVADVPSEQAQTDYAADIAKLKQADPMPSSST